MIYLIHGQEYYLVKEKLNKILKGHNEEIVDLKANASIEDLLIEASSYSIFDEHKIILIKNPIFLNIKISDAEYEAMKNYLDNPNDHCTIIFIGVDLQFNGTLRLYKLIKKYAQEFKFEQLKKYDFRNYIIKDLKNKNLKLSNNCINLLLESIPNDLEIYHHEVEKLLLFNGDIDERVIGSLITRNLDENVFNLINYIIDGNTKVSIIKFRELIDLGVAVQQIIAVIAGQFRFLNIVSYLHKNNYSLPEIVEITKAKSFRIEQAIETIVRTDKFNYLKALSELSFVDQVSKSTTEIDINDLMELYITKIIGELK